MSENNTVFSEEVEKAYRTETESAIDVPDGFKKDVINKVKIEKMKNRKKTIIAVSSAAAALVVALGAVFVVSTLKGPNYARSTDDVNENASYSEQDSSKESAFGGIQGVEKVDENVDNEERTSLYNDSLRSYLRYDTYKVSSEETGEDSEVVEYNWYEFFNAVVDGSLNPTGKDAKQFIKDKMNYFDGRSMTEEKAQAKIIIDAVNPFKGFPEEQKADEDYTKNEELSSRVLLFYETNQFAGDDGAVLSWPAFYNACLDGKIDPRFGLAKIYLDDCRSFFEQSKLEEGLAQSEKLLSAAWESDGQ